MDVSTKELSQVLFKLSTCYIVKLQQHLFDKVQNGSAILLWASPRLRLFSPLSQPPSKTLWQLPGVLKQHLQNYDGYT